MAHRCCSPKSQPPYQEGHGEIEMTDFIMDCNVSKILNEPVDIDTLVDIYLGPDCVSLQPASNRTMAENNNTKPISETFTTNPTNYLTSYQDDLEEIIDLSSPPPRFTALQGGMSYQEQGPSCSMPSYQAIPTQKTRGRKPGRGARGGQKKTWYNCRKEVTQWHNARAVTTEIENARRPHRQSYPYQRQNPNFHQWSRQGWYHENHNDNLFEHQDLWSSLNC